MFSHDLIKKRILVFGSNGMLGHRTISFFAKNTNIELLCSSIERESYYNDLNYIQADITNRDEVKRVVFNFYPDVVINAAAFTNVDKSESQRELAWKVNVKAVEYISEMAHTIDAHLIHFSTDYIFDGLNGPYSENDRPNPLCYYGRTKLASENVLKMRGTDFTILRTNVLYGTAPHGRLDFVRWVIEELNNNRELKIVTDQFNNPNFIDDLVQAISKVIEFKKYGIYNIGGKEFLNRYDFTMKICEFFNLKKSFVKPILTKELHQPARRPLKGGLVTIKAESELGYQPISIKDSLQLIKKELNL
jgi:dTDP-4-dehydrorhamnose reductase